MRYQVRFNNEVFHVFDTEMYFVVNSFPQFRPIRDDKTRDKCMVEAIKRAASLNESNS